MATNVTKTDEVETIGVSPKVLTIWFGVGGPALVLLILGLVIPDDTLKTAGITGLVAALGGGGAAYYAKPGTVSVGVSTTKGP